MATTTKKVSVTSTSDASLLKSSTFDNYTWTETKTAGVNTFVVDKTTKIGTLTLTGTGDSVKIDGYSGDFAANISGSKLTLTSGTQKISITLAKASTINLEFNDGTKVVDFVVAKTPSLGGVALTSTALPISGQTTHEAAALKLAADKAAADNKAALKATIDKATADAVADKAAALKLAADKAAADNTAALKAAIDKATTDAVADKAAALKLATDTAVADKAAALKLAADAAAADKAAAVKAATDLTSKDFITVTSAATDKAAALKLAADAATAEKASALSSLNSALSNANSALNSANSALSNALVDSHGVRYTSLDAAITSDNITAINTAISTATGGRFTTATALGVSYGIVTPTFSVTAGAAALEGNNASFTVTLSAAQASAATVNIALSGANSATTADYGSATTSTTGATISGGVLTLAAGVTSAVISVPTITDSQTPETGEGVTLTLSNATGSVATIGSTAITGTVTITDVAPPSQSQSTASFNISAASPTGTATSAADAFTIAAGQYSATISSFGSGDTLIFANNTVKGVSNSSGSDGNLTVTGSLNGQVVTVNLTNVSSVLDAQVIDMASFATAFAAVSSAPATINSISSSATSFAATAGADTFNIAAGQYIATISTGFGLNDKLVFATGTVKSISNTSGSDGNLTVTGSLGGQVVTINLTGVNSGLDGQVIDSASFITAFGAGSLV
jgi:hypothetical protein